MAKAYVCLAGVMAVGPGNGMIPIADSQPYAVDYPDVTATSAQSAISCPASATAVAWCIIPAADMWVKFGAAPVAAPGTGWLIKADVPVQFKAAGKGEKIALVLA